MNISRLPMRFLCIAPLLLLAGINFGQGFLKTYSPATAACRDLVQTADGGYFMAGEISATEQLFLQKTDLQGNIVWTNHMSLNGARAIAACLAPDGSLLVLAENYSDGSAFKNVVLKLEPTGSVVWQTVVGNSFLPNGLKDIICTSDGNILAAGETRDAALQQDMRLVKLDQGGNILWSQSFGDPGFNEQVSQLVEVANGDIVISGFGLHGADRDMFLVRTNASGTMLWQNWYAKPATQYAHDLLQMSDGGFMVLGETYGTNPTWIALLKTDANGNEQLYKQIYPWPQSPVNQTIAIYSFARDAADNVYIPGLYGLGGAVADNCFLLKVDANADVVWKNTIPGTSDLLWKIINTADNRFAIGGGFESLTGALLVKTNTEGEIYTNKISGSIYFDADDNCVKDSGEPALTNFIVKAQNQSGELFYKNVNADGNFLMPVSEGNFTLSVAAVSFKKQFWVPCGNQVVAVSGQYQTVQAQPLGVRSLADCPQMYVEIAAPFLRRCASNKYDLVYCNNGNTTATAVMVELTLSGPELIYNTSSIPLAGQNGNVLTFNLPDVDPGECASFSVSLIVDCVADLGDLFCVEAHIFPDTICPEASAFWDGSHLEVEGDCNGDVTFRVSNTGTGDMEGTVDYVIVEDQIMYMQGYVQLNAGQDTIITVPNPTGGPYFLQTEQRPGHPGLNVPSAIVSPCGGAAAASALQFPNNEADPFVSIHCDEVIGSYDPNDKRGFPLGWQDAHYIEPGQELEYMIRFQNTGTDTAFQVVVRDTISAMLDAATVRPGPASHPYIFEVNSTGVLTFRFPDIMLADSMVNEPASHGYVMFSISQQPNLPMGTVLENNAAIYFDYNDPVITNTTFHTVGHPFTTIIKDPSPGSIDLQVYPNPFVGEVNFHLSGVAAAASTRLTVVNTQGKMEYDTRFTGSDYVLRKNDLTQGVYFFRMEIEGKTIASGRLIVGKQ